MQRLRPVEAIGNRSEAETIVDGSAEQLLHSAGAAISLRTVSHRYAPKLPFAFRDVNLDIRRGEAVALVGRSGCGKSTLLHIISGLLHPTSGTVQINESPVNGPSPKWVMMFQAPHLFPWLQVRENICLGPRFLGWKKNEIYHRLDEVIKLVGLEQYATTNVQDLSGGQQQRVALARSLVMQPDLLLLDEPFSALDAFTRETLQREVRTIAKKMGVTLVLVTHDISEAVIMADRAIIMAGSPGEICDELSIDLPDPRLGDGPAVKDLRSVLMKRFQVAAGVAEKDSAEGREQS